MDDAEKALREAERAGIDLNLLDLNLALAPEQRVLKHAAALELVLALRARREETLSDPKEMA